MIFLMRLGLGLAFYWIYASAFYWIYAKLSLEGKSKLGHVRYYIHVEYFVNVNNAIYIIWLHFKAKRLINTPVNEKRVYLRTHFRNICCDFSEA